MHLIIDSGADFSPEQRVEMCAFHRVPLFVTLDGKTYRSGVDIQSKEFFELLAKTNSLPVTAQPSPIDFVNVFRKLLPASPDMLCVLMSSGLSGTVASATTAATMVPNAHVTIVDTKTVSGATGWQVEAAGRAIRAGWTLPQILELLEKVRAATDGCYTLETMRYLVPGGRITSGQAFLATLLNIKPIISIDKEKGVYVRWGQATNIERAIRRMTELMVQKVGRGTALRAQIIHGNNLLGVARLRQELEARFACTWLPTCQMAPVLGAHSGPSMIGVIYAPLEAYPELP